MKRIALAITLLYSLTILTSCGGNVPLERLTISLILGIDLDDQDNLIISESNPVFSKNAKKKVEVYETVAKSIRESRKYFDSMAMGKVTSAKIQVLLIGKRILEHEDWFPILDTIYRNPNFSINTRVIVVDSPVSDVMFMEAPSKPQISLYLKDIIDENHARTQTVNTTVQLLHRQMFEKGITPSLPEIKKKPKDVQLVGTALLDESGKLVDTLSIEEASFLLLFMNQFEDELTISIPMQSIKEEGGIFNKNELSMDVSQFKLKLKTGYKDDRFSFSYTIRMKVHIIERLFPTDLATRDEMEMVMEKEVLTRLEHLIQRIQEKKIDPIGLGLYARAFQYEHYKEVEDHWGEAIAKANIDVSLDIDIESLGGTK